MKSFLVLSLNPCCFGISYSQGYIIKTIEGVLILVVLGLVIVQLLLVIGNIGGLNPCCFGISYSKK